MISIRDIGRTRPRLLSRSKDRRFKRMLRVVLRSNESAAFSAPAALCKIQVWRYSSRHGLARIIQT